MRKKRILVKMLTRVLYAGGIVFLVSGMLLSAISTPVLAAETSSPAGFSNNLVSLFNPQQGTAEPLCTTCGTPNPLLVTNTLAPGGDTGSSLIFVSNCECSCDYARAAVCNVGNADMTGAVNWRLYYSLNGNPQLGSVIERGSLGPLKSGECTTLDNGPAQGGNFMYRVYQEEGYEGPGSIWSSSCVVSGDCFPEPTGTSTGTPTATVPGVTGTATPTATIPFVELTLTATSTATVPAGEMTQTPTPTMPTPASLTVTPAETSEPMPFNLSAICGYASDDSLLWRVYNQTNQEVDYTWEVDGSDESGTGQVEAMGTDYFTTTLGDKTVRVFVDGELVDTETNLPVCKQELVLSHTCSANGNGIDWFVTNPNDFSVRYGWTLDGQSGGSGNDLPPGTTELIITSPLGEHTVDLTWNDTRPGDHMVSQTGNIQVCNALTQTPTVTATATIPFVELTLTPTMTSTQPATTVTATTTSTNTATLPPVVLTQTSTVTQTVPAVTVTPTSTSTVPFVIVTFSPTPSGTATSPFVIVTVLPTSTVTPTPSRTATVPFVVVTSTVTPTPSRTATVPFVVVTPTPSGTATAPFVVVTPNVTRTNTQQPPSLIQASITPTLPSKPGITPTATQLVTLAPPVATSTPPIIPVTGVDALAPVMALNVMAQFFTNLGLVMLGLALALTGITGQWKG